MRCMHQAGGHASRLKCIVRTRTAAPLLLYARTCTLYTYIHTYTRACTRVRSRGGVGSAAEEKRPGFGARRVFLPPVWPPPQLIVFCLPRCMRCIVPLLLLHLLRRLVQVSFPPSAPFARSTMQPRPLHRRRRRRRRPKYAHTSTHERNWPRLHATGSRSSVWPARCEPGGRRTPTRRRCTRSPGGRRRLAARLWSKLNAHRRRQPSRDRATDPPDLHLLSCRGSVVSMKPCLSLSLSRGSLRRRNCSQRNCYRLEIAEWSFEFITCQTFRNSMTKAFVEF